jgi:hypothetical protein
MGASPSWRDHIVPLAAADPMPSQPCSGRRSRRRGRRTRGSGSRAPGRLRNQEPGSEAHFLGRRTGTRGGIPSDRSGGRVGPLVPLRCEPGRCSELLLTGSDLAGRCLPRAAIIPQGPLRRSDRNGRLAPDQVDVCLKRGAGEPTVNDCETFFKKMSSCEAAANHFRTVRK